VKVVIVAGSALVVFVAGIEVAGLVGLSLLAAATGELWL
jgi:hypothetical protein